MIHLRALIAGMATLISLVPAALSAQTAGMDRLFDTLRMSDLLEIMSIEAESHATALEAELFPGGGGASWQQISARIHNPARSQARLADVMARSLTAETLEGVIAFFDTDLGTTIITAEVETRRAFLDPDIERAAEDLALDRMSDAPDRYDRVKSYMRINSLVQQNVAAALNSSLALYRGLQEGGAYDGDLTTDMILRDVMESEPELRISTARWLEAFLGLAYDRLSDAEFDQFLEFSASPAGQAFNTAIFDGFSSLFEDQSYALGLAAARYMGGTDL